MPKMKTSAAAAAAALLTLVLSCLAGGCNADPHDTHVTTDVVAPR